MPDAEYGILHVATIGANPHAVFVLDLEEDVVGACRCRVERGDRVRKRLGHDFKGHALDLFTEIVREGCRACDFSFDATVGFNFLEACVDLAEDAHGGCPRGLSAFGVLQGNLQVQILALALDAVDAGECLGRKSHHRNARRAGERFLRARDHDVSAECAHVEGVRKEGADAVYDQEEVVPLAEIADKLHVVMHAGRCLVLVHDKGGIAFALVGCEVFRLECLARLELDFGKGDFVQFAEFHETVAEASSVHDDSLVRRGQGVHDGGFHAGGTRSRDEGDF